MARNPLFTIGHEGRELAELIAEREPSECHRTILAKRIARRLDARIVDL